MVITLPSGNWMESVADSRAYLVIFSDEERTVESRQSYLGKSWEHQPNIRGPRLFDSSNLCNNINMEIYHWCNSNRLKSTLRLTSNRASRIRSRVPQHWQQNPTSFSRVLAPWPVPVLPAGSALRWLWGDRLVRLDHLPPGLQRLPLCRLVSVPAGGEPQSHQPCHSAFHHARTQTLQRRGDALLRPRQAPVHQPTVLWWRGECRSEAVWRHGGVELRLSLIGCAPLALLKTRTEGDVCFIYFHEHV